MAVVRLLNSGAANAALMGYDLVSHVLFLAGFDQTAYILEYLAIAALPFRALENARAWPPCTEAQNLADELGLPVDRFSFPAYDQ